MATVIDPETGLIRLLTDSGLDLVSGLPGDCTSSGGGSDNGSSGGGDFGETSIDPDTVTGFKIKSGQFVPGSNFAWLPGTEFAVYDTSAAGTSRVWYCKEYADVKLRYDRTLGWYFQDYTLMGYIIHTQADNPFDSSAQWEEMGYGDADGPITLVLGDIIGGSSSGGSGSGGSSGGGLKVSGVSDTMAAMITPNFVFADGDYSPVDASATGHGRVWKLENGGTAFYFRWSETEQAWTLAETANDPAAFHFPYIYSTVTGNDPWTSSGWEFSLTGPVSITVTKG